MLCFTLGCAWGWMACLGWVGGRGAAFLGRDSDRQLQVRERRVGRGMG
jgi:hypothetical protein